MKRFLTAIVALAVACMPEPEKTPQEPDKPGADTTGTHQIDTTDTPQVDTNVVVPVVPPDDGTGTVLVIGGGSSGVCAAIQAARLGVDVILVEETPWLGGMLTSAGVSATDGNHKMRQGLFGEFADALVQHYGSISALKTGWVSNMLYSPKVAENIFETWVSDFNNLTVIKNAAFKSISGGAGGWTATFDGKNGELTLQADIVIDCTELGDVAKAAGVRYRVGMDSPSYAGESMAIGPNNVVQDLTMVMTLKNYSRDVTIAQPEGYDESLYYNSCKSAYNVENTTGQTIWSASEMMSYGLLPNGEIMINWPIHGNDYYVNLIEMSRDERAAAIAKAKLHSLGFLYYLQTKIGYKTWGLANDQYPTDDRFPLIPYHRESRRIEGEYLFGVNEAVSPFDYKGYRTGIAVGDYPVDHHHWQYPDWQSIVIDFPKIVPFTLPLGVLIPKEKDGMLVAEKSISVTNLINGSTRLQPVTMELGQAAGALAALALKQRKALCEVHVRDVQDALLSAGARLQPYLDLEPASPDFRVLQRIGSTGIMRGKGETIGWSNECHFRTGDNLLKNELFLEEYYDIPHNNSTAAFTGSEFVELIEGIKGESIETDLRSKSTVTRLEAARLIDSELDPFHTHNVSLNGDVLQ
ncbi:MAG: FAD-dependent oxidoreductase [Bacteroidales bacterium]|nr:FAD-dependent oxidoreductase [Bacteroidales bacterium]